MDPECKFGHVNLIQTPQNDQNIIQSIWITMQTQLMSNKPSTLWVQVVAFLWLLVVKKLVTT